MVFQYRKSSGEVLGVSADNAAYAGQDATYYASVQDPPQPNGADLSTAKIWDGTNLRNATSGEISGFPASTATDLTLQQRAVAWNRLQGTDAITRKMLQAIVSVLLDEINTLRTNAALGLSARTMAQAKTAILNKLGSGTVD